jgi:hypothetical protein
MSNVQRETWDAERALGCGLEVMASIPVEGDRSGDRHQCRLCRLAANGHSRERAPNVTGRNRIGHQER